MSSSSGMSPGPGMSPVPPSKGQSQKADPLQGYLPSPASSFQQPAYFKKSTENFELLRTDKPNGSPPNNINNPSNDISSIKDISSEDVQPSDITNPSDVTSTTTPSSLKPSGVTNASLINASSIDVFFLSKPSGVSTRDNHDNRLHILYEGASGEQALEKIAASNSTNSAEAIASNTRVEKSVTETDRLSTAWVDANSAEENTRGGQTDRLQRHLQGQLRDCETWRKEKRMFLSTLTDLAKAVPGPILVGAGCGGCRLEPQSGRSAGANAGSTFAAASISSNASASSKPGLSDTGDFPECVGNLRRIQIVKEIRQYQCLVACKSGKKGDLERFRQQKNVTGKTESHAAWRVVEETPSVTCGHMAILELDLGTELAGFSLNDKKKTNAKDRENALVGELAKTCDVVVIGNGKDRMRLRGINGTFFVSTRLEVHFRVHDDDDERAGDPESGNPDRDRSAGPPSNKRRRLDQVAKECPLQVVSTSCEFPRLFSVLNNERIRWQKAEEEKRKRRILRVSVSELDSASKKSGLRLVWDESKQGASAIAESGAFAESGAKHALVSTKTVSAEESPNSASLQANLQGDRPQDDCYSQEGYFCGKLVCNQNAPSSGESNTSPNATGSTSTPFLSAEETHHLQQAATKMEEKDYQNGDLVVEEFEDEARNRGTKEEGKGIDTKGIDTKRADTKGVDTKGVDTKEVEIEEVKFCNKNFITVSEVTMAPKKGSEVVVRAAVEVLEKWGVSWGIAKSSSPGKNTEAVWNSRSSTSEPRKLGEVTGKSTSNRGTQVVDLGCGSGCLLLSVAWESARKSASKSRSVIQNANESRSVILNVNGVEQNRVEYHGVDISSAALEVSKLNYIRLKRLSQHAEKNVNQNCVGVARGSEVARGSNDNKSGKNVNKSSNEAHTFDNNNVHFHLGSFKNFAAVIEGSSTNHNNNRSSSLGRNNTDNNTDDHTNSNQNLLVLCNPPYLTPGDYKSTVNEGSLDPELAMIGTEKDGLGAYREAKRSVLGIKASREIGGASREIGGPENQVNHPEIVIIFEIPERKIAQVIELMSPEFAVSGRFTDDYGQQRCVAFNVADAN